VTEQDWRLSADPQAMLDLVGPSLSERRLQLLLCAGLGHVLDARTPGRTRQALDTVARFADGLASDKELLDARSRAWEAATSFWVQQARSHALLSPEQARRHTLLVTAANATARRRDDLLRALDGGLRRAIQDDAWLAGLLREVVGNPFRPVACDPAWLLWGGKAPAQLAQGVYQEGAFDRLPVLADALEEAGCADPEILGHRRQGGGHVHGSWGLELLLGLDRDRGAGGTPDREGHGGKRTR
jgi:hypothetical protein